MANVSDTPCRVATYNLHGFNQGQLLLQELCERFEIIAVQEHWLGNYDLHKLVNFHDDFKCLAWSAMTDKLESSILRGRPYGGIGLLIRKSLNVLISQIQVHHSCRCVVCLLTFPSGFKLLLSVVYFPCNNAGGDYVSVLLDCLGFIEQCIDSSKFDGAMLLGDLNFDCETASDRGGLHIFRQFAEDKNMVCCDSLGFGKIPYTYFQEMSGKHSAIDHIFVDTNLSSCTVSYDIFDECVNLSDHWPVVCTLNLVNSCDSNVKCSKRTGSKSPVTGVLRWDKGNVSGYYDMTYGLLQDVSAPSSIVSAKCDTFRCNHWNDINSYYHAIVDALNYATSVNIPCVSGNTFKHYWSQELNDLKRASFEAHQMWLQNGKPNSGLINDIRRDTKYKYKLALRHAQNTAEFEVDDELSQLFLRKDTNKFWHKWHAKVSRAGKGADSINGVSDNSEIAQVFSDAFNDVYFDSYKDGDIYVKCIERLQRLISVDDCVCDTFNVDDIEESMINLKNGKAPGYDGLTKEHIYYAHPIIICHLKILFNLIYAHGFVPDDFGKGVTVPVPKDKLGDLTVASNYRPITISPVISKLFEYCVLNKFADSLQFSHLQFGFRKNSSCSHAIFLFKEVVNFFVSHGSNVYIAALDARKAFDRVNHVKLFGVLLDRGMSARLIKVICDWYGKTVSVVKWYNCLSEVCTVKSGIRQGGILSPILFNIYTDVILRELSSLGCGCHLGGIFVGCIAYADDIILISASLCDLQRMLNVCYETGSRIDIIFNTEKSFLFKVGKVHGETLRELKIGDQCIKWVDRLRYLGVHLVGGKMLKFDISVVLRKVYGVANSILAKTKYVSDLVKLSLIEAFVFPVLMYGLDAIDLSQSQLRELSVCVNNIYRRIFNMNQWESVKLIQFFCGRLDFLHMYNLQKLNFMCKLSMTDNPVIAEGYWHFKLSNYYRNLLSVHEIAACDKLGRNVIHKRVQDAFTGICLSRV